MATSNSNLTLAQKVAAQKAAPLATKVLEPMQGSQAPSEVISGNGRFKNIELNRFFLSDGSIVEPDAEGYFPIPSHEAYEMLVHYSKKYRLVEWEAASGD